MSSSTFNKNKCWGRLQSKPHRQCSYKQSIGNFCKKHHVLWKKGKLTTIEDCAANTFVRNSPYIAGNSDSFAIAIQSVARGRNIRKNIKLRGASVYCRHLSNNKTDCIDFRDINDVPIDNYFSFIENNIHWGFSMDSFKYILKYNQTNPYSTKEISNKAVHRFSILRETINNTNNKMDKKNKKNKKDTRLMNNKRIKLQQECIQVFQIIDELNNYTKCSWFLSLPLPSLKALYVFMEDMWNYRLNLTKEQKLDYIRNGILFNISHADIKKNKNYHNVAYILLNEFKRLLTEGKTTSDKTTASHWILSGLTLVNLDARNALPWLFQSALP